MKKIPTLSDYDPDIIRHVAWGLVALGIFLVWLYYFATANFAP